MNKESYIQAIHSYLYDGSFVIPAGVRKDLAINGITINHLSDLIDLVKNSLTALEDTNKLVFIPEGVLANIKNYIESTRTSLQDLSSLDQNTAQNSLSNISNYMEQTIAQIASYLNIADSTSYRNLDFQASELITLLQAKINEDKKLSTILKRSVTSTEAKSKRLLERISSGVLSENFQRLGNSKWNYLIMFAAFGVAVYAFVCLIVKSNELNNYLIEAFSKANLDYRVFLVKWSTSIPYLLLLSVAILELRNRIRNRDIYMYRENVAGSIDGYTESLLNKVSDIKNSEERDKVRAMVIKFMIDSMLELTKSPTNKNDKHSIGVKVKDIAEATISN